MDNVVRLKKAVCIKIGSRILVAGSMGVLVAKRVLKVTELDNGKWVEVQTGQGQDKRLHIISGTDVVAIAE